MKNFSQKFAIRCTENEWRIASVDNKPLYQELITIGYDLSELKFYPDKPYIATPYKNRNGKLGSTNTPAKDERQTIETWNADLFYALCCQLEGDEITAGEFFTNNVGKVYQCTRVENGWIVQDYGEGKNAAFQKARVHKSTFEELVGWFTADSLKSTGVACATISIERPKKEPMKVSSTAYPAITKLPELSVEQAGEMISNIEASRYADSDNGPFIKTGRIQSTNSNIHFDLSPPEINFATTGPMTFKEILEWFGDGNDVVVGSITDGEIKCTPHEIEGISRDVVALLGKEKPVPFDQIYKSKESFLLHALNTLKKQA